MSWIENRSGTLRAIGAAALLFVTSAAFAQYDPPAGYYSTATGTGATLKSQLHSIIAKDWFAAGSTNHRVTSYGNLPQAFAITDLDPSNSSNILLVYTGQSVSKVYDSQVLPWNREHTWPDSRGINGTSPAYSDMHHLFPCDTDVNGARANLPYGLGSGYWDPNHGANDRGDMARAMFYMDVRYEAGDPVSLTLVNGQPSGSQMGDLATLLQWNYQDPPSTWEKLRNQRIFDKTTNPTYYQGNRNPFIDHPEYVWSIFGPLSNNSRLYVGASPGADGSSSINVSLGRVMKNGTIGTASITINKTGSTPTTYNLNVSGNATSSFAGTGNTFDYNNQTRSISVGLNASASMTGLKSGSLTLDNTDLTTAGAGQGSADGNDVINVSANVVDDRVVTASPVDFGRVIGNKIYTATTTLTTGGADSDFTRVTVSGAAASSNGITVEASANQLFASPADSITRDVSARFRSSGLKGGVVPLSVSGEGLAGEAVNAVSVSFSAVVMGGPDEGALPPASAALSVDFGQVALGTSQRRYFDVLSWLHDGGLDGAVDLASLQGLVGDVGSFGMNLDSFGLSTDHVGEFSAMYVLNLENGQPLSITLEGMVVPEPASIAIGIAFALLSLGRHHGRAIRIVRYP